MSARARILEAQQARHEALSEPRPYTRTIELTREINGFSCQFEVSVKQWTNGGPMPSIDCVSAVDAFNKGGHQVRNESILSDLNALAEQYAQNHLDEILEQIQQASAKGQEALLGIPFLHEKCEPLRSVKLMPTEKGYKQVSLFGNECEGLCGV